MSLVIRLPFNESATAILPSDSEGNVLDFTGDTGATPDLELPAVVDGLTGPARRFTENDGGTAADVDNASLLTRDMSIQCLILPDLTAQAALAAPGVVIANHINQVGAVSAWQLQIDSIDAALNLASMRFGWSDVGESDPDIAGAEAVGFVVDGWVLLTATRHWVSASEVRVRYYLNAELLDEVTSAYGDIDGAVAAPVTIGCRETGADYENFLEADVDGIIVTDHEMSGEEVRQTYMRLAVHQPQGRLMLQPLLAKGKAYSIDADSGIQEEIAVEGDGLGYFYSANQEMREDYFPDRAWSMLEDWERVCRLPPRALDTYETRRNRIVGYLRQAHGYAAEDVQRALADVLDLTAAQVEILNYTNKYEDEFATALADFWTEISPVGSASVVSAQLRLILDNAADGRWEKRSDTAGPTIIRHPIDGHVRDADPSMGVDLQIKVISDLTSTFANGNHVGLCAWNLAGDLVFFGFRKNAGAVTLGWRIYEDDVLGAWTSLAAVSPPYYIRLRFASGNAWQAIYHVSDPDADTRNDFYGIYLPTNIGVCVMQEDATNPSQTQVDLDEYRAYMPLGLRVFCWYAYADPALGGTPDLAGARAIVERMKPADSLGGVVATATGYCECDDSDHGCDEAPCT
jgi:hypothetical protein